MTQSKEQQWRKPCGPFRIGFTFAALVYKAFHVLEPSYPTDSCSPQKYAPSTGSVVLHSSTTAAAQHSVCLLILNNNQRKRAG